MRKPTAAAMLSDVGSDAERAFLFYWRQFTDWPEPLREYTFHDGRRWRFDFAWPQRKVSVEVEGGVWVQGRHVRGSGFRNDCEKYNAATLAGWRVLRFTPGMLEVDPEGCVGCVVDLLEGE